MATIEQNADQLEARINHAHEERKRLLKEERKLKNALNRKLSSPTSPRMKNLRSPKPKKWEVEAVEIEDAQKEFDKAEAEYGRLKKTKETDTSFLSRLRQQEAALMLIHTNWEKVEASITKLFKKFNSENGGGSMDVSKVLRHIRDSATEIACLVSLPRVQKIQRPKMVTLVGFLNILRPRAFVRQKDDSSLKTDNPRSNDHSGLEGGGSSSSSSTMKIERIKASAEDMEKKTDTILRKITELEEKLQSEQSYFRNTAQELRRGHGEATEDCKVLQKRVEEERRKGVELGNRLQKFEKEALALGPGPITASKHAALQLTLNRLQQEKKKLGISLAAMHAVQSELEERLKMKGKTLEQVINDLAVLQANHRVTVTAEKTDLKQQAAEIIALRNELGLSPNVIEIPNDTNEEKEEDGGGGGNGLSVGSGIRNGDEDDREEEEDHVDALTKKNRRPSRERLVSAGTAVMDDTTVKKTLENEENDDDQDDDAPPLGNNPKRRTSDKELERISSYVLLRKLENAQSLIGAKVGASLKTLVMTEDSMRVGLSDCQKRLAEVTMAARATQELMKPKPSLPSF